ncbi:MAG: protoheme IX farnesyltransferase, partial [Deltaproteobacteria bacterium]|nr:protoheme IX farnesyltransferase [Deltaproteobacteria bacterium]
YVVLYTVWLKRRSWTNIIIGGLAGSFAVLAGGASSTPGLCAPPLLLALVMFFWTPSHFWSFAIVHREDYGKAGVPMLPNVVGESRTARYILANTVSMVALSFLPALFGYMGMVYAAAAAASGVYFIIRNIQLVRDTSKDNAWKNFKASMLYLGVILLAVIIDSIIQRGG